VVEPHGILVQLPVWYVLAVDRAKQLRRMFRMGRISAPAATHFTFTPDAEVVAELTRDLPGLDG